jgi:serine protease Do
MDPIFNVALLRVPEVRLPPLPLAADRPPQVGDWVVALGTSFRAQPTQSVGNVAFLHRDPRVPLLQLTNAVYPGNSGGAALNPRGELVGIVEGELGAPDFEVRGPDFERRPTGTSLVLPIEVIRPAYEGLRAEGRVRHGYLGVTTRAASVESETSAGSRVPLGAFVEAVIAQSPAAHAGLRRGDLVVGFEGDRVEYPEQLARWVAATRPGVAVDLVWVRDEIRRAGRVVLSESPGMLPAWAQRAGSAGRDPAALSRISQIERQIRDLNRRLGRLKGESSSVLR